MKIAITSKGWDLDSEVDPDSAGPPIYLSLTRIHLSLK